MDCHKEWYKKYFPQTKMEKLKITTLTCRDPNFKYEGTYNPQWAPYMSEQDFQTILKHLNLAGEKGPNQGLLMFFYFLIAVGFIGFIGVGFNSVNSGPNGNFGLVFVPFIFLIVVSVCAGAYRSATLSAVDKELGATASKLSAELGSKKLLIEYHRNLYAIKVRVSNNRASTENKYDYDIHIYYLRESIQQPQVVLDINSILPILQQAQAQAQPAFANLSQANQSAMANMTPEMQAQFAAFLAQQGNHTQAPPPYKSG
ncbi:hypothetical protein HK103_004455 [Boothiomyces macroporosus]|uniref:Uncharacterized protein n=1 Tax=Boothiomyces macroporosus TaxID=261099 RepID=A0AAD5Y3E4_9FUNG|nr:hypothetical protein HK103_004455 [Boothiomyces macroporosus]